jgi:hypothetical protein
LFEDCDRPRAEQKEAGPERLSHQIRGYWGVENIVLWRRDVLCREDKCRLRNANAACILALLRTALITLVRCSGYDSLNPLSKGLIRVEQRLNRRFGPNITGYPGVAFDSWKWKAQITVGGKHLCLGRYSSPVIAAKIYNLARAQVLAAHHPH